MHIVSHEFMLNRVAVHGHINRKLLRSLQDWLILEMFPTMRCFDFEKALSKSGKEGSFRKCSRENRGTKVISKSEIPIYEIPINYIKACYMFETPVTKKKCPQGQNAGEYSIVINIRDSKAGRAFSDTVAELNL